MARVTRKVWLFAVALCGCGGAPFTAADLVLPPADAESLADATGQDPAAIDAAGDATGADADAGIDTGADIDTSADVDPEVADAGADAPPPMYTHYNGLGQTWVDSTPPGTYNRAEAVSACSVSPVGPCYATGSQPCPGAISSVSGESGYAWAYSGPAAGHVSQKWPTWQTVLCPQVTDPTWE
jgi:hypothetical protein